MKVAIVSDTHGYIDSFIDRLSTMDRPDLILHLGDNTVDGEKISQKIGIKTIIVKGNCDSGKRYSESNLVEVEGKKLFLTHGHMYNVKDSLNQIYYKGLELGADIILFGHTHIPINIKEDNIIIMNPGSPTIPKSIDKIPSFGIIEFGEQIITKIIQI